MSRAAVLIPMMSNRWGYWRTDLHATYLETDSAHLDDEEQEVEPIPERIRPRWRWFSGVFMALLTVSGVLTTWTLVRLAIEREPLVWFVFPLFVFIAWFVSPPRPTRLP